jgi:hypothetical protein
MADDDLQLIWPRLSATQRKSYPTWKQARQKEIEQLEWHLYAVIFTLSYPKRTFVQAFGPPFGRAYKLRYARTSTAKICLYRPLPAVQKITPLTWVRRTWYPGKITPNINKVLIGSFLLTKRCQGLK